MVRSVLSYVITSALTTKTRDRLDNVHRIVTADTVCVIAGMLPIQLKIPTEKIHHLEPRRSTDGKQAEQHWSKARSVGCPNETEIDLSSRNAGGTLAKPYPPPQPR